MQWTDSAIVLSAVKYGESSAIVSVLTENKGLCKGFVRGISGKKNRGIYQPGNFIEVTWRGRISEQLGGFTAEMQQSNAVYIMSDSIKLNALGALCSLLDSSLPEREENHLIYIMAVNLIEKLKYDDKKWMQLYALIELEMLSAMGFGLDLSCCAATGEVEDLKYLSPKSGRAVSAASGLPYKDKLFELPEFFINSDINDVEYVQIINALEICAYFLEKYIFKPHNANLPLARLRFMEMIKQKETV